MSLKILHITKYLPPYKGGVEFATEKLAQAALSFGHSVCIAGVSLDNTTDHTLLTSKGHPWDLIPLKSICKIGPIELAPGYFRLQKYLEWADIIHIHMPNPLGELATFGFLLKKNSV